MWPSNLSSNSISWSDFDGRCRISQTRSSQRFRCLNAARRQGFSLVELMVVMIILGLLATATTVATRSYMDNARQTKVTVDIATFIKGLDSFYAANGRYPTNDEGLAILAAPTKNSPAGYLNKISKDPWKNSYEYISPGSKGPYEIICLGADGKEGGQGTDRDTTSVNLENE